AGQADRLRQLQQVILHQGDVGGLDGDSGAGGTHRHADVGGGQGRGVVDAVADHRDGEAFALELLDDGELVLGQQLGADLVHPDLGGDRLGDPPVVTGEHDDLLHAVRVEPGDHLLRIGADPVGDGDHADHAAVESDDHRGASESGEPVDLLGRAVVRGDALGVQQRQVAHGHASALEGGDDRKSVVEGKSGDRRGGGAIANVHKEI